MRRAAITIAIAFLVGAGVLAYTRLPTVEPTAPGKAPEVEFLARNLTLLPGAENAVRIGFHPDDPAVQVRATLGTAGGAGVLLCPLAGAGAPLPPFGSCRSAGSGVRESVTAPGGRLGGLAIVLPDGDRSTLDLTITYAEASRAVSLRLPFLGRAAGGAACADNACNPFFEMSPTRSGRFSARARWDGGGATLVLLQGRVRGRSMTATGIPYSIPATRSGRSPLAIDATMTAPGEYALAFSHPASGSATDIRTIEIDARWP